MTLFYFCVRLYNQVASTLQNKQSTMTAFTTANIPSTVNSLEKLAAWVGLALTQINPSLAVLESANESTKVAQTALFRASDNTVRLSIRLSIPIDPNYGVNTAKFWGNAQDLSNTALPTAYTTN